MATTNQNFWVLRQNYSDKTDQEQMKELILLRQFVACPWGGWGVAKQNVVDGVYNTNHIDRAGGRGSNGQDKRFVEEMQIGDIVLIPFAKKRECILGRIISDVAFISTGLYWTETGAHIKLGEEGTDLFCPVGRRIQIIRDDFVPSARVHNQRSLSKMSKPVISSLPAL